MRATRVYADDLAISGGELLRRRVDAISQLVARIAVEEGFEVNHRKTRPMHRGDRQDADRYCREPTSHIRRDDYDRLKAILTNCIRHGSSSQNRHAHPDFRAHLAGRIAYVAHLNPVRARSLQLSFGRWRDSFANAGK
jgi:hypothetical protein